MSKKIRRIEDNKPKRGFWSSLFGLNKDDYSNNRQSRRSWYSLMEERQEIIAPFMGNYDKRILSNKIYQELLLEASRTCSHDKAAAQGYTSVEDLVKAGIEKAIPPHLVSDIYNLYYHPATNQSYSVIDETNSGKWKLLQKVNDSSVKIMTNGNAVNSCLFTEEICKAIMSAAISAGKSTIEGLKDSMANSKANHEEEEDEDQSNGNSGRGDQEGENNESPSGSSQSQDSGGGSEGVQDSGQSNERDQSGSEGTGGQNRDSGEPKNSSSNKENEGPTGGSGASKTDGFPSKQPTKFDKLIDRLNSNGRLDKLLQDAKQKAFERAAEYEKLGIDPEKMNDYGKHAMDIIKDIDAVKSQIEQINLSNASIRKVCEKIIATSISYFSKKSKINEVGIFEADLFDEVEGLEFLNPVFKGTMMEDVVTREEVYYGKINVYVDVSGSMDGQVNITGARLSRMLFAKALILKMMDMDLVNKVIPFGNNIKPKIEPPKILDVLNLSAHCGTSLNNVVRDILKEGENSLVITDGCDRIDEYSPNGFFLGTPGASFHLNGTGAKFGLDEQLWVFDNQGSDIHPYRR